MRRCRSFGWLSLIEDHQFTLLIKLRATTETLELWGKLA
jgi:hypothetical protein